MLAKALAPAAAVLLASLSAPRYAPACRIRRAAPMASRST